MPQTGTRLPAPTVLGPTGQHTPILPKTGVRKTATGGGKLAGYAPLPARHVLGKGHTTRNDSITLTAAADILAFIPDTQGGAEV
jgi:hypothetical protein